MNEVLQKEAILEHHLSSPNKYVYKYIYIYIGKINSHFQANLVKDLFCQVECTPMEDWKTIAVKSYIKACTNLINTSIYNLKFNWTNVCRNCRNASKSPERSQDCHLSEFSRVRDKQSWNCACHCFSSAGSSCQEWLVSGADPQCMQRGSYPESSKPNKNFILQQGFLDFIGVQPVRHAHAWLSLAKSK